MAFPAFFIKYIKGAKSGEFVSRNATDISRKKFSPNRRLKNSIKERPSDIKPRLSPDKRIDFKVEVNQENGGVSLDTKTFNPTKRLKGSNNEGSIDRKPRLSPDKKIDFKVEVDQENGGVSLDTKTFNPTKRLKGNNNEGSIDRKPRFNPDRRMDLKLEAKQESGGVSINTKSFNPSKRLNSNIREGAFDKNKCLSPNKRINPDIEKIQNKLIKEAEQEPGLSKLDTQARGNYAEMKVDRDLANKGYKRLSKDCVSDLKTNTGPGIDGVYKNIATKDIAIVEVKFNKSKLGNTLDGKQMSSNWINNRLDASVGKKMADEIRMQMIKNPDSVKSVLAKVDMNTNISYSALDKVANVLGGTDL